MFRDEVIGRSVSVIDSSNPSLEGLSGVVLEDTRSSLLIDTGRGGKRLLKAQCTFAVGLEGHERIVSGAELLGTPDQRA